jgi:hypothetical protein
MRTKQMLALGLGALAMVTWHAGAEARVIKRAPGGLEKEQDQQRGDATCAF